MKKRKHPMDRPATEERQTKRDGTAVQEEGHGVPRLSQEAPDDGFLNKAPQQQGE